MTGTFVSKFRQMRRPGPNKKNLHLHLHLHLHNHKTTTPTEAQHIDKVITLQQQQQQHSNTIQSNDIMMSKVTQDGRRRRLIGRAAMERLLTFPPTGTSVTGNGNGHGHGHGDDLREEDVWGNYSAEPPAVTATTSAAAPARRRRWFEKGGLSAAFDDSSAAATTATTRSPISALRAIPATSRVAPAPPTSAPVSVPEWGSGGGGLRGFRYADDGDEEEEEDYVDEEYYNAKRVPPHEYLAAQAARSGTKTMSVVEGVGRTLKGRDASRVRDAVWNQTGFLG